MSGVTDAAIAPVIIISVYAVMRLLWTAEFARVGTAGKPHWVYTVLDVCGP